MLRLGILCSGLLGFDILKRIVEEYEVVCVLTDHNSTDIITYANDQKISLFRGNPREGKAYTFLTNHDIDVLVSVNYLFLIEEDVISYPNKMTFNIHGSLLPKYRGRTPHVWAIINGETITGITAHKIDAGCDTGDIIEQVEVPILTEDTGGMILEKYTKLYFPLIQKVLEDIRLGQTSFTKQDERAASFFGKRTPDDGQIDWNWDAERIRNWVRAQSYPYPGAFTFYGGKKIVIDKIAISNTRVSQEIQNGEIIETTPQLIVKCNDRAVIVQDIRTKNVTLEFGNKFEYEDRE